MTSPHVTLAPNGDVQLRLSPVEARALSSYDPEAILCWQEAFRPALFVAEMEQACHNGGGGLMAHAIPPLEESGQDFSILLRASLREEDILTARSRLWELEEDAKRRGFDVTVGAVGERTPSDPTTTASKGGRS